MKFIAIHTLLAATAIGLSLSTQGIQSLVQRRLPDHAHNFEFSLVNVSQHVTNDSYVISSTSEGKILVEGNTLSALSKGLHRFLTDVAEVDFYWFIGNRLNVKSSFPQLSEPLSGQSIVPWRYHFNTVTFSYTSAFWTWSDWETQLDWMALHGINLPLAWVGVEKVLVELFQEVGLTDDEIFTFLSGPAFQAWNRFGNIQGSWGGRLPYTWIEGQFELQKKIVARMVELGMTPILPAFTGFVPRAITRALPNATVVNGSQWNGFQAEYTNVTFLQPFDPQFAILQKRSIEKQQQLYGNITKFYTLDQYNENDPYTGDLAYLKSISQSTWQSIKAADPDAVWVMQGWLFTSNADFWTNDRIEAYLSGVNSTTDMLILDLFSESSPQWQRTNSYFGKPWVWCQLHNYGGNMGLYGQIENITVNPIEALSNSSSLVGFGLTMEGQEGNEIVYDLLLDQAWSSTPIDTEAYFYNWVTRRYAGASSPPQALYQAWEIMRATVYNNTDLTTNAVSKSILELTPSISGLANRTGHHATTVTYDPSMMKKTWYLLYSAALVEPSLWSNPSYQYDIVDITRQLLSNAFTLHYNTLMSTYKATNATNATNADTNTSRQALLDILRTLDKVLSTNTHFRLTTWINAARSLAPEWENKSRIADFYEYNARNQITLWGPQGEISDYASKSWSGLVSSYYLPRWAMFINHLSSTSVEYNQTAFEEELRDFELEWQSRTGEVFEYAKLKDVMDEVFVSGYTFSG
ncbi:tim-barrel domain-containing protein [Aspergillus avenaceus]|uniref:Tim-barrel domain-containing protein n=1 Tax=Aspergillus avenaceus TaxID=36643 RepID=A0A5N6TYR7_ASPAV|nr:tim-barrel domain-containing protein [Aspergillus avenaceus]